MLPITKNGWPGGDAYLVHGPTTSGDLMQAVLRRECVRLSEVAVENAGDL